MSYCKALLVPVSDPASGQIVRGEFQRNPVAVHHFDPVTPQPSSHGGEDGLSCIEFDGEHPRLELLNYLTHHFNCVFFWQIIPLSK